MAKEIEKKYLVKIKELPKLKNGQLYIQGYICLDPLIRFRIVDKNVFIVIKKIGQKSNIRDEWEFCKKMSTQEIKKIITLSVRKIIKKIRYKLKYGGLVWEIDVYQGENRGLITADVELKNINQRINFPEWINKDMEISDDSRFFNKNLGENPYKNFKKDLY